MLKHTLNIVYIHNDLYERSHKRLMGQYLRNFGNDLKGFCSEVNKMF